MAKLKRQVTSVWIIVPCGFLKDSCRQTTAVSSSSHPTKAQSLLPQESSQTKPQQPCRHTSTHRSLGGQHQVGRSHLQGRTGMRKERCEVGQREGERKERGEGEEEMNALTVSIIYTLHAYTGVSSVNSQLNCVLTLCSAWQFTKANSQFKCGM